MAAEVTGRVTNIYPAEAVGDKQKQSFTIKTADQYPKDIAFECWGKTLEYVAKAKVGDEVKVSYDISSREYNNRWYTTAKAFKIEVQQAAAGEAKDNFNKGQTQPPVGGLDDLPFRSLKINHLIEK